MGDVAGVGGFFFSQPLGVWRREVDRDVGGVVGGVGAGGRLVYGESSRV